jgi:PAS domain S-box-containing protein
MFGYGRGELEGKNVSVLMPQPFSARHDSYLNNYLTTGVSKVLNTTRSVVALTKVGQSCKCSVPLVCCHG